jgi:GWxTD domain-containing protein
VSSRKPLLSSVFGLLLAALGVLPFCPAPSGAAEPPADAASKYNRPDKDWYEGPVRYILSREEEKQYRALVADEERARFIEDFWARRDEDPSTPANEFEIRFWKRVAEADGSFHDAPYPGWKTDRGKLHILLGPPDEIQEGQATGRFGKEVPYVIWIYHRPRFEGMDRDTEIRFLRDPSGEMRMTDRLFMGRVERFSGVTRSLSYQAGVAQKPPEPKQLLDTIAASRPPMDSARFHTHYDFFLAADGSTSVVLTLGIRPAPPDLPKGGAPPQTASSGEWKVYARLSDGVSSYDLVDAGSFRTSEVARGMDGFLLYQGRVSAPPGAYSVFYGIQDPTTAELFSLGDRVQVPDFTGAGFSLSSITLAARLEPAERPEENPPFLVGRLTVIPKMDPVFKSGSEFAYYFQVYHPQLDPATGQASLDLTYQFFRAAALKKTGDLDFTPVAKPLLFENQSGQVHGRAIPLKGWPPGEFKIRVQVRDRIADRTIEAEARFSVN